MARVRRKGTDWFRCSTECHRFLRYVGLNIERKMYRLLDAWDFKAHPLDDNRPLASILVVTALQNVADGILDVPMLPNVARVSRMVAGEKDAPAAAVTAPEPATVRRALIGSRSRRAGARGLPSILS